MSSAGRHREAIAECAELELELERFERFDGTEPDAAIADDDYPAYARAVAERARLESSSTTGRRP